MKVEIKKLPKSTVEMLIEFDPQEWGNFVDGAVRELSKSVKVEGFRPGNAPRQLLEQTFSLYNFLFQQLTLRIPLFDTIKLNALG